MKTTITILLLTAVVSFAAPFTINVTDAKQAGLTAVVARVNAEGQAARDARAVANPAEPAYVTVTNDQYLSARVKELLEGYEAAVTSDDMSTLRDKMLSATPAKRAAAKTAAENALK